MGNPPQKQLAPSNFGRQAHGYSKPLLISAFTHRALWSAFHVYARKHVTTMQELQTGKLLIQSAFTLVNRTKGPVYRQHPIWG
jgi:hypothetical protein